MQHTFQNRPGREKREREKYNQPRRNATLSLWQEIPVTEHSRSKDSRTTHGWVFRINWKSRPPGEKSVVCIAYDYGLDGPGSNPGGEEIFRLSRPALGAHPASCKMGTGSFPGVKCGRGVLLTTHPLLVPRSWKSSAIPLPTLWVTPGL